MRNMSTSIAQTSTVMNRTLLRFKRNLLLTAGRSYGTSTAGKQTPAAYCVQLVRASQENKRKHDYENFLCTLLLSNEAKAAAFAIRAFNVEVAHIRDQVSDHKIGQMRLQFWTDALNQTYKGNPPRSPVMLELHRILQSQPISKHYFKRLIDSRLETIRDYSFNDMTAIERYAEYSSSSVYYLLLEAHGVANVDGDHAASHMGKAHGIVNLIRSVPYNAGKRVNMLPQDILVKHNVSTEAVLRARSSKQLRDAIYDVASCGKLHLDAAIALKSKIEKKRAKLIFLPIICLQKYLEELRRADFDVFDAKLQRKDHLLAWHLYWKSWNF